MSLNLEVSCHIVIDTKTHVYVTEYSGNQHLFKAPRLWPCMPVKSCSGPETFLESFLEWFSHSCWRLAFQPCARQYSQLTGEGRPLWGAIGSWVKLRVHTCIHTPRHTNTRCLDGLEWTLCMWVAFESSNPLDFFFQRHQTTWCFSECLPRASELSQFMPVINMRFQNTIHKSQGVATYNIIKRVHIIIIWQSEYRNKTLDYNWCYVLNISLLAILTYLYKIF